MSVDKFFKLKKDGVIHSKTCRAVKAFSHLSQISCSAPQSKKDMCGFCVSVKTKERFRKVMDIDDKAVSTKDKRKREDPPSVCVIESPQSLDSKPALKSFVPVTFPDYHSWPKSPFLETSLYSPERGEIGEKFRNVVYAANPESRMSPMAQKLLSGFRNYEKKDGKDYSGKNPNNFKTLWRDMQLQFIDFTSSFHDGPLQFFILDAGRMRMTKAIFEKFGFNKACIDITNPHSSEMIRMRYCPYDELTEERGAQVSLYGCFTYEFFGTIWNAWQSGILSNSEIPRYDAIIYDACGFFSERDAVCIDIIFKLGCFKESGPSILTMTFAVRQSGDKVEGEKAESKEYFLGAQKVANRVRESALDNGFTVFQPRSACIPISNGKVYTLMFCVLPSQLVGKFNIAELKAGLDKSVEDNSLAVRASNMDFDQWKPSHGFPWVEMDEEEDLTVEKKKKKKKSCCSLCGVPGHYRNTCPN